MLATLWCPVTRDSMAVVGRFTLMMFTVCWMTSCVGQPTVVEEGSVAPTVTIAYTQEDPEGGGDGSMSCDTLWDICGDPDVQYDVQPESWQDNECGLFTRTPCGTRVTTNEFCSKWEMIQGGISLGFTWTRPSGQASGNVTFVCSTRTTVRDSIRLRWKLPVIGGD